MGIVLDCILGFCSNTKVALLEILLETDYKVGSLLISVEVSSVRSKAGATGEDSVTETAGELDVVDVLRLEVVLQVGGLVYTVSDVKEVCTIIGGKDALVA